MHLAAESIPVAEKQGAVNASIALKMSLYIYSAFNFGTVSTSMVIYRCGISQLKTTHFVGGHTLGN
jgi:hypothetical protein